MGVDVLGLLIKYHIQTLESKRGRQCIGLEVFPGQY
jgi:hypothetical protein